MKNRPTVSNLEFYRKPGWNLLLAISLLVIGAISLPTVAVARVVTVGSVGNLQAVLTSAQNNGVGDTIMVAAGFYAVGTTLTFTAAESFPLAIIGEGAHDTTLDGGLTTGILNITNNSFNAPVTVRDISFWRGSNSSSLDPGLSVQSATSVNVENCLFTRNTGGYAAFINVFNGGVGTPVVTLTNNIFSGNYAPGHSALYVQTFTGEAILTNNTFIGNRSATNNFSAIFLEALNSGDNIDIYNNIVWGEYGEEASLDIVSSFETFIYAYNNISRGLSFTGTGTVSTGDNLLGTDPLFQTPGYWDTNGTPANQSDDFWVHGNYRPLVASPAIDTGSSTAPALPTTDFDGNPRVMGSVVDRGAYEYDPDFPVIKVLDTVGDPDDLTVVFGNVLVGTASSFETVNVSNDGNLPLSIGTVVGPSLPFTMFDSCSSANLDPVTDNCNIIVQFSPIAAGIFTDTLSIPSNDPNTPLVAVSLAGEGVTAPSPEIAVSPMSKIFGDVIVGDSSPLTEVTITNVGISPLDVSAISYDTGTDFYLDVNGGSDPCGTPPLTIVKNESCTVDIAFRPQITGPLGDNLTIVSNDPGSSTESVFVTGNGVSGPTPRINVSPLTHLFNDTIIGIPSDAVEVTLSNIGNFDLHVSDIAYTNGTHFTLDEKSGSSPCNSLSRTIVPSENCTVEIVFDPLIPGVLLETLTITSDATVSPSVAVSLTGYSITGPEPDISVSPMDYGFSEKYGPEHYLDVTISNVGLSDLHVTDINLTTGTQFNLRNSWCYSSNPTIAPGGSCTVEIEFVPEENAVPYEDTLVITSDDWNEPQVIVALRGEYNPTSGGGGSTGCSLGTAMSKPEGDITIGLRELLILIAFIMLWRGGLRRVRKNI
jgi:hypothetical protein